MAIGRLTVGTGGKGKATNHAAYVARTGAYEKYLEKGEVLEAQGSGNMPAWAAHDASVFWKAADAYERANGTAYREYLVSLPRELSPEQRVDLVEAFIAQEIGERHPYQYAIHVPKASDGLDNPHVHLMFSERRHDGIERDPEEFFKRYNAKNPEKGGAQKGVGEVPHTKLSKQDQAAELKAMRGRWEELANRALEQSGHDARISMKSYWERGLDIKPEPKQLPSQWLRGGMESILAFRESRKMDLEARRQPAEIIDRVSSMKAVFTRADLYRELNKVTDDAELFNRIKSTLDAHPDLIPLEIGHKRGSVRETLTTQSVIDSEQSIRALGSVLSQSGEFGLGEKTLDSALSAQPILSEEQVSAVKHVTQNSRLSMIAGVAGAGKSTALSVVREGYESAGFRVSGMALAGKAADELQGSSGIESRTIASWLYRFDRGDIELGKKDVVVLDEAGMVNNATMERVLDAVNQAGAKAILVGDAEQLQPIQAGCPFRVLSEELKATEIVTVRRQKEDWQRQGTQDLSRGKGVEALKAYRENGCVHQGAAEDLVAPLVENYLSKPESSAVILAHRNKDVAMLNAAVRETRKANGELQDTKAFGELELAVGDRVVFLENNASLGVKNGQFGEVVGLSRLGANVEVKRDDGKLVSFSMADYDKIAHGYASTIHKSQGMTVDRAMVWGSASLDRHLGYVAMSRHREQLDVYQPDEASRVRSLEQCLSRSNQAASVQEMMESHGLAYRQGKDGQARLCQTYPTAVEIDQAKLMRREAVDYARNWVAMRTGQLNDAVQSAKQALAEHRSEEPPGRRLREVLKPGASQRWVDWQSREIDLNSRVQSTEREQERWKYSVKREGAEERVMQEHLNAQLPDLLSAEGGVERDADGGIVITDRYPGIARKRCEKLLSTVRSKVVDSIERETTERANALSDAEDGLYRHRLQEPTDSKFEVFLYVDAKEQREAWDARLSELEARVDAAAASVQEWGEKTKDGRYEKDLVWEQFSSKAPDQAQVNRQVIAADSKRVDFNKALSAYHQFEKSLESPLDRGDKKVAEQGRDQLLKQFGRESNQRRLPDQITTRAKEHQRSVAKSRELQRSLSRGHGMER